MHEVVETILKEILGSMGLVEVHITHSELAGQVIFSIQAQTDTRFLAHDDTLHALDLLVKRMVEKRLPTLDMRDAHILIDTQEYRTTHIKDLQTKAQMMADRARSLQYDVELEPMSAYERLIVHTTIQGQPQVTTESQGDGRDRRVVIKYVA